MTHAKDETHIPVYFDDRRVGYFVFKGEETKLIFENSTIKKELLYMGRHDICRGITLNLMFEPVKTAWP